MERLFLGCKRGKFVEKLYRKFKENDKATATKAVAVKLFKFPFSLKVQFFM